MNRYSVILTVNVAGYIALLTQLASAQITREPDQSVRSPGAFRQLIQNTQKLRVETQLDRPEYFPGEDAVLT